MYIHTYIHINIYIYIYIYIKYVGYRNLNKVIVPRVIPMAKEGITVPRSPCTRTVRPEWGHTREEELQRKG